MKAEDMTLAFMKREDWEYVLGLIGSFATNTEGTFQANAERALRILHRSNLVSEIDPAGFVIPVEGLPERSGKYMFYFSRDPLTVSRLAAEDIGIGSHLTPLRLDTCAETRSEIEMKWAAERERDARCSDECEDQG